MNCWCLYRRNWHYATTSRHIVPNLNLFFLLMHRQFIVIIHLIYSLFTTIFNSHCCIEWVENRWCCLSIRLFLSFFLVFFYINRILMIINHKFICIQLKWQTIHKDKKKFIRILSNVVKLNKVQAKIISHSIYCTYYYYYYFFQLTVEMLILFIDEEKKKENLRMTLIFSEYFERWYKDGIVKWFWFDILTNTHTKKSSSSNSSFQYNWQCHYDNLHITSFLFFPHSLYLLCRLWFIKMFVIWIEQEILFFLQKCGIAHFQEKRYISMKKKLIFPTKKFMDFDMLESSSSSKEWYRLELSCLKCAKMFFIKVIPKFWVCLKFLVTCTNWDNIDN